MCKSLPVVILVLINTVFAAAGCLMLAFGIAAAAKPESVIKMLSYTGDLTRLASDAGFSLVDIIQNSAIFLIVMGAIVALVGLFGCVGACCRVKCLLGTYICILLIVLLAEIALIIFAALFPEKFKSQAQPAMQATLMKFDSDGQFNSSSDGFTMPSNEIALTWASMQFEIGCCGAFGYQDYTDGNMTWIRTAKYPSATVPFSCCKLTNGPGVIPKSTKDFVSLDNCLKASPDVDAINNVDCYSQLELLLKQYGRIGIGIAAAIIGVEVILIILAACICRSIGTDTTKAI